MYRKIYLKEAQKFRNSAFCKNQSKIQIVMQKKTTLNHIDIKSIKLYREIIGSRYGKI